MRKDLDLIKAHIQILVSKSDSNTSESLLRNRLTEYETIVTQLRKELADTKSQVSKLEAKRVMPPPKPSTSRDSRQVYNQTEEDVSPSPIIGRANRPSLLRPTTSNQDLVKLIQKEIRKALSTKRTSNTGYESVSSRESSRSRRIYQTRDVISKQSQVPRRSVTVLDEKEYPRLPGRQSRIIQSEEWIQPRKKIIRRTRPITKDSDSEAFSRRNTASPNHLRSRSSSRERTRRPPRSAVVALKGPTSNFSYAGVMKKLKAEVNLQDLEIDSRKIKYGASGSLLVEIRGPNNQEKANTLAAKIKSIIPEEVSVSRPQKRAEIKIIGFDESVSNDDIIRQISLVGECDPAEIKVGQTIVMKSGLGLAWVHCPLAAAIKVSSNGRLRLGWTTVRTEVNAGTTLTVF